MLMLIAFGFAVFSVALIGFGLKRMGDEAAARDADRFAEEARRAINTAKSWQCVRSISVIAKTEDELACGRMVARLKAGEGANGAGNVIEIGRPKR